MDAVLYLNKTDWQGATARRAEEDKWVGGPVPSIARNDNSEQV